MAETCPVLRICHENPAYAGEFVEINESDFDPGKHTLWTPPEAEQDSPSPARKRKRKEQE